MTRNKKLGLLITVIIIVIAVWYLESIQAHPGSIGSSGVPINVGQSTSSINTASSSSGTAAKESLQALAVADAKAGYQPAIEIADPTGFINATSGFMLSNLVGKKVILLDFWTYSCINCIRTVPYLKAWYQKYSNEGLVIVGIHTPEFDFEKDINNVQAAVQQYGIHYPVVLDSNYGTWQAYGNLYWPHEYLIDTAGYILHDQVGEGSYAQTEAEIQKLLTQRNQVLDLPIAVSTGTVNVAAANLSNINSPETYFGSGRNDSLANGTPHMVGVQNLQIPPNIYLNQLYLGGSWNFQPEFAIANAAGAKIVFHYASGKVYFVASAVASTTVEVLQDDKPISSASAGSDVHNGEMVIGPSRLYNVVNNSDGAGEHTLELIIESPGLQAFTFTFG
jgi:thiol-disulfide isomerase/thioredoxin